MQQKNNAKKNDDWLFGNKLNVLTSKIEKHLSVLPGPSPFENMNNRFLIACTSRSGSRLLSQSLALYGADVQEYFQYNAVIKHCQKRGISDLREYCCFLAKKYGSTGVFGVKGAFYAASTLMLLGEFPQNLQHWKFVHLERTNMVRQAVSLCIAELSGSWTSKMPAKREVSDADYDHARLADLVDSILAVDCAWKKFFAVFGISPMRLTYEELTSDPENSVARVADFLGLEKAPGASEIQLELDSTVKSQTTNLNQIWEERFREEVARYRFRP